MFQSYISHLFSQESSNFKFLGELSEREGAKFKLLEKLGIYYFLSFLFPQISGSAPKLDPAHLLVKLAGKKHEKYRHQKHRAFEKRCSRIALNGQSSGQNCKITFKRNPLSTNLGKTLTSAHISEISWKSHQKYKHQKNEMVKLQKNENLPNVQIAHGWCVYQ